MVYFKELGKRMLAIRNKKGLTQEELAERTELSNTYIAMLETGKRSPSLETLYKLAEALNVGITELFGVSSPSGKRKNTGIVGIELTEKEAATVKEASRILGKRIPAK